MSWDALLGHMYTHTLRSAGVENRLGAVSRSYMDLGAAAQQTSLERKGSSVALIQLERVTQPCCCFSCLVFWLVTGVA